METENSKYCPHCLPKKNKYHIEERVDFLVNKACYFFSKISMSLISTSIFLRLSQKLSVSLIKILSALNLAEHEYDPEENRLRNRVLIFFKKGKELGLDLSAVKILGYYGDEFRLKHKGKTFYFPGVPIKINDHGSFDADIREKEKFKKLLRKHDFPTPDGDTCYTYSKAKKIKENLEYPLVVKPADGSLSAHTFIKVSSDEKFKQAFEIARQFRFKVMIEDYIPGDLFRATTIGQEKVYVCKKEPANVVGDGQSNLKELIKKKNSNPKRGGVNQRNTTLHKIPNNEFLNKNLKSKNITLDYVPDKEEKVYLHDKAILSQGCDVINKTTKTHPKTKEMLIKISKIIDNNLVGFDFICTDPSKSPKQQEFAIIEANSFPYADMHQIPSHGSAEPVAEKTWEMVLDRLE